MKEPHQQPHQPTAVSQWSLLAEPNSTGQASKTINHWSVVLAVKLPQSEMVHDPYDPGWYPSMIGASSHSGLRGLWRRHGTRITFHSLEKSVSRKSVRRPKQIGTEMTWCVPPPIQALVTLGLMTTDQLRNMSLGKQPGWWYQQVDGDEPRILGRIKPPNTKTAELWTSLCKDPRMSFLVCEIKATICHWFGPGLSFGKVQPLTAPRGTAIRWAGHTSTSAQPLRTTKLH